MVDFTENISPVDSKATKHVPIRLAINVNKSVVLKWFLACVAHKALLVPRSTEGLNGST